MADGQPGQAVLWHDHASALRGRHRARRFNCCRLTADDSCLADDVGPVLPVFPRRIATRPLPTRYFAALVQRAVPVLSYLEKIIHPRWPTPLETTKRLVGTVVLFLSIALVLTPIPLSNIVPALVIALISLAYLEEDGLLLSIALAAAVIVLTAALLAIWETVLGAKWLGHFW